MNESMQDVSQPDPMSEVITLLRAQNELLRELAQQGATSASLLQALRVELCGAHRDAYDNGMVGDLRQQIERTNDRLGQVYDVINNGNSAIVNALHR